MSDFRREATPKTTGFPELDAKLRYMATAAANRITTAAVRVGLRESAKFIRDRIPLSIKKGINESSKGIGVTTNSKKANGTSGKVGAGVGKTMREAGGINAKSLQRRGKRKGVGVSARNLHWFAMGTEDRYTGSKRIRTKGNWKAKKLEKTGNRVRFVGRIDKLKWGGFVKAGFESSLSAVEAKMRDNIQKNLAIAATKGTAGAFEGLTGGD
jgi:hypothetical protein